MSGGRVHVVVAEPSPILCSGLVSVLESLESLNIDIAELHNLSSLRSVVVEDEVDVVIVDPRNVGALAPIQKLLDCEDRSVKFVALKSAVVDGVVVAGYDAEISILDSISAIEEALVKVINQMDSKETELTQREIEIVAAIAKGASNKEIAEQLFISTYTVMTHRRNISAKLNIHSPAGLTIYAIVNNLIDIKEVKSR